ncbi:MAG: hypothetical protein KF887_13205 [Paracoccaceae bacterium]|nr:MAG: hypothetical protein KF887_13205 [Paracoccaceae bacterium]
MAVTIEKIQDAEKQINTLVRQEKAMEREFMADGTIDPSEKKQLSAIAAKITKLKGVVAALRKELEENRREWEGRKADYARLQAQLQELRDWGHADTAAVAAEVDRIAEFPPAQRWKEATAALGQAMVTMGPVHADYTKQASAKAEYEPLRADLDARFDAAEAAEPREEKIAGALESVSANTGVIDGAVAELDYIDALSAVRLGLEQLEVIEEAIRVLQDQKAGFDTEWGALKPRLDEVGVCEFPDLLPMQEDLLALRDEIEAAGARHDYPAAFPMMDDASTKLDTYMTDYAAAVDARTHYEARVGGILAEVAETQACEFDELIPQQDEIKSVADAMEAAAAEGRHEVAMVEMDRLVPLIDAWRLALETARLKAQFDEERAALSPRVDAVAVCEFGPLLPLSEEILNGRADADSSAAGGDYAAALRSLEGVRANLDRFEGLVVDHRAAQADYEARVDGVLNRFDAIARSDYPQLEAPREMAQALHDDMLAAAQARDFITARDNLDRLEAEIGFVEDTLADLDARRAEYETRLPALISRFDSSMVSDYAELEDERADLTTARSEMEAAAAARDFMVALDMLDALERMLNDLDAQIDNLDNIRRQYEELYAQIKDKLATVEGCSHAELKPKKDPIIALRDAMLAAAQATDFATALEKANALVAPLNEFMELEELLEEYLRRLKVVEPRIETARGFPYKSLDADKKEIETLLGDMKGKAAAADLKPALEVMGKLEDLVGKVIARNEELKKQEAVYKKLHGDMQGKIDLVGKNKIEKAKDAAKAVLDAHKAMEKLGEEHEFEKAVEKADEVRDLIEKYLEIVAESEDARLAFETLRDMADEGYAAAKAKADEYEDLEKPFKDLEKHKSAMDDAAKSEDWETAKKKAEALLEAVKTFDAEWQKLTEREAALAAAAQTQIDRFKALPSEAKDKAQDEYDDASRYVDRIKDALKDKELDRVEEQTGKLKDALDAIDGALKTQAEHKAEYEGRLKSLQRDLEAARGSDFAKILDSELKAVTAAFDDMTAMADREDYEGAVKKADDVEAVIAAFQKAESALQMDRIRFEERMEGLAKRYAEAAAVTNIFLIPRVTMLKARHAQALKEAEAGDYAAALESAAWVRTEAEAILDLIEEVEDAKAKEEGEKSKAEKAWDLLKDTVLDEVIDRLPPPFDRAAEKARTAIDVAGNAYDTLGNLYDAAGNLLSGDFDKAYDKAKDAAGTGWDAAKGVAKLSPAGQIYEEAMDGIEKVKEIAETISDLTSD